MTDKSRICTLEKQVHNNIYSISNFIILRENIRCNQDSVFNVVYQLNLINIYVVKFPEIIKMQIWGMIFFLEDGDAPS